MDRDGTFSGDELDLLQELFNIGFGSAGAELAAALGKGVALSVPSVQAMPAVLLRHYLSAELKDAHRISAVEQHFQGGFQGFALLVLPAGDEAWAALRGAPPEAGLERVGRLIVSSCLGKLAELLGSVMTYGPMSVTVETERAALHPELPSPADSAVVLRTSFRLEGGREPGHLFLTVPRESVRWLKAAMRRFLLRYA